MSDCMKGMSTVKLSLILLMILLANSISCILVSNTVGAPVGILRKLPPNTAALLDSLLLTITDISLSNILTN